MSSVKIDIEIIRGITFVVIQGVVSVDALVKAATHPDYGSTELVCWDLRGTDFSHMTRHDFTEVAKLFKDSDGNRETTAGAVVLKDRDDLRTVRLFTLVGEHFYDRQLPIFLTTRMDEAMEWLAGMA